MKKRITINIFSKIFIINFRKSSIGKFGVFKKSDNKLLE